MYLQEVYLENVKCFERLELDFMTEAGQPRLMTVILGDNGVGKSTLLQAIGIAIGLGNITRLLPERVNWLRTYHTQGEIKVIVRDNFSSDSSLVLSYLVTSASVVTKTPDPFFSKASIVVPKDQDTKSFYMVSEEFRRLGYGYGPLRSINKQRASEIEDVVSSRFASLFGRPEMLISLEDWLIELDRKALIAKRDGQSEIQLRQQFHQIIQILLQVLPKEHFNISPADYQANPTQYVKTTSDGLLWRDNLGTWVTLSQLSDGYQSVLAWVGDLVSRLSMQSHYKDISEYEGVVLIDEIDIHLHPTWQRQILADLRRLFPKMQFVVTTHSPLVAGSANPGELFVLQSDQGQVTLRPEPSAQGWRADQILTEIFDLKTTRDVDTEQLLAHYDELLAQRAKGKLENQAELIELENKLRQRLPLPSETPSQRALYQKMQDFISQTLSKSNHDSNKTA